MQRRLWHVVGLLGTASLLAASCSASPTAAKHNPSTTVTQPAPAPTTSSASGTGNSGTGNSGTGNTGTGNSGSGNTGTGNSAPRDSGTVVTLPNGNVVNGTGPGPQSTTTTPAAPAPSATASTTPHFVVTRTGRIRKRHTNPVIKAYRPQASRVGGVITIVGKRLSKAQTVSFDGIPATIRSDTSGRITAVVPAGATSGPISVVTADGSATVQGFVVD